MKTSARIDRARRTIQKLDQVLLEIDLFELEKSVAIPTPNPYTICDDIEPKRLDEILNHCAILWRILHLLRIPASVARANDYTLNIHSMDLLEDIAHKRRNRTALKLIRTLRK